MIRYLIFLLLGHCTSIVAQTKLEREYRVKPAMVPERAHYCIQKFNFDQPVKWYFEEGLNGKSFEAKTRHHNRYYSIEFDTSGVLLDIEIIIDRKEVDSLVIERIHSVLNEKFDKYKIDRFQIQYSGHLDYIFRLMEKGDPSNLTIRYELVIKTKRNLFEFLFSETGHFEQMAEIIPRSSFNLEF
jgi:hypothetical protein